MSELSMPKKTTTQFSGTNFVTFFIFLCSFLISKLTYLVSLLPYLLKLLHFLSPLLITTFLVLLFTSYKSFIENASGSSKKEELDDSSDQEHEEVYKIFFEASQLDHQDDSTEESQELVDKFLICIDDVVSDDRHAPPEKMLEELSFQEKEGCEKVTHLQLALEEEKQVKEIDTDSKNVVWGSKEELGNNKVIKEEETEQDIKLSSVSRTPQNNVNKVLESNGEEDSSEVYEHDYEKMRSFGSMRVEKEWKRTLACKLFEERHNNGNVGEGDDDEEGMDLLWETYEDSNLSSSSSSSSSKKHVKSDKKKLEKKRSVGAAKSLRYRAEEEDDNEEEEEDEDMDGKICCLQALKFSAGKVNLGMGRPNIGRISKAFRGIGWLHHVSSNSKKVSPLKPKVLFG